MDEEGGRLPSLVSRLSGIFIKSRDWVVSRSGLEDFVKETEEKRVPKHALNPMYCLGGVTFVALIILGLTGIFLSAHYEPSILRAQRSIQAITTEIPFGFYAKSIHSWSANIMVVTILLHTLRVFLTGSYKNPREFTWIGGVLLLVFTFSFIMTGYILLWDDRSRVAATSFAQLVDGIQAIPYVGGLFGWLSAWVTDTFIGYSFTGEDILTRAYWMHVTVLPLLTLVLLLFHFYLIRKHGISGPL